MAIKRNYKPISSLVPSSGTVQNSLPVINENLTTALWDKLLLRGTARYSAAGTLISGGAVVVWLASGVSMGASMGSADYLTFTDGYGRYAVTVTAHQPLTVRVYS
jgi:hypothetical protein